MNGPTAGAMTFACLLISALAGAVAVRRAEGMRVREPILLVIRRTVWMVTIMAAMMLVALTVYLKIHFDTANRDVRAFSFQIIDLDHSLRRLGPPAEASRALLFRYAARTMKDVWPQTQPRLGPSDTHASTLFNGLEGAVVEIPADSERVRELLRTARDQVRDVGRARWTLDERTGRSLSPWMVSILVLWFMITFAGLGLSSQRSRLALSALAVCAAVLGSAVFLAVEYADPYQGVIIVSSEPMRNALFAISD
jgi:hypothetical protein